jgi:hypothetical protein
VRSESELFVLWLVAAKDWIKTEEIKSSLIAALNSRDTTKPLRFGLGHDTMVEMLMNFLGKGWLEVEMPPGDPECGVWKVTQVGWRVLSESPKDLQARLGFSPVLV